MNESTRFPVHMKSLSGRNYYRILSPEEMVELQIIGGKYQIHRIKASILPERILIEDLLASSGDHYPRINADEFDAEVSRCRKNLVEIT